MQRAKWPKGLHVERLKKQVREYGEKIKTGRLVAVDPGTYLAGYAIFEKGVLVKSGQLAMSKSNAVNRRLWALYDSLGILTETPDVLAIEMLRGNMAHDFLKWSAGIAVAAVRAPIMIEVPIAVWHALRDTEYVKGDQKDAELLGQSLIWFAKDFSTK